MSTDTLPPFEFVGVEAYAAARPIRTPRHDLIASTAVRFYLLCPDAAYPSQDVLPLAGYAYVGFAEHYDDSSVVDISFNDHWGRPTGMLLRIDVDNVATHVIDDGRYGQEAGFITTEGLNVRLDELLSAWTNDYWSA